MQGEACVVVSGCGVEKKEKGVAGGNRGLT